MVVSRRPLAVRQQVEALKDDPLRTLEVIPKLVATGPDLRNRQPSAFMRVDFDPDGVSPDVQPADVDRRGAPFCRRYELSRISHAPAEVTAARARKESNGPLPRQYSVVPLPKVQLPGRQQSHHAMSVRSALPPMTTDLRRHAEAPPMRLRSSGREMAAIE